MSRNYHLLIIEDNAGLQEVLRDHLETEGFSVTTAPNGQVGLAAALEHHPDLILLDVMMPAMDGVTVIQKLREANEWGKQVPVIVLTNVNLNDTRVDPIIAGLPAYYLVKTDLSLENLVEKIRERLDRL